MENIIYEKRGQQNTSQKIFSFYGNLKRECFDEKFLMVWRFCKKQFSKRRINVCKAEMPKNF